MFYKTIIILLLFFPPVNDISNSLVVIGRLKRIVHTPDCGYIHFGALAEYDSVRVVQGVYNAKSIFVIHGCPELSRSEYAKESGSLQVFRIGDYHRLELVIQNIHKVECVIDSDTTGKIPHPDSLTYFAKTVDLIIATNDSVLNK
jgi:hypothetical protein